MRNINPVPNSHDKAGAGSGAGAGPGGNTVSIHEVAAAAGVSIATVSRVINNAPSVASATAAKVRRVVEQLGYVPNPLAKGLGTGETRVIGLALPRFHGEFMSWLLHGADEEAARLGYHLMMTTITPPRGPDGKRRRSLIGSRLIDAMIVVVTDAADSIAEDIGESGVPAVIVDADLSDRGLDSVVLDNERGTREAVEHLLRWVEPDSLYFVGGPRTNFDSTQRASSFTGALRERGCTPSGDQVAMGDYSVDWGKEWATRMVQRGLLGSQSGQKGRVGAVIAANDKIACGIMDAAEAARVWVPSQLRIVGFNDSQMSQLVRPRLSTVALPMAEMGATAVRTLMRRIEQRSAPPTCVRLATRLIVRESSTAMNF
ncbi:MAG: LacI family DNA-binding transcriptional regulator [Phycisphaerales bacterium]|nr:LacI family DNA-binding transcriptional regulator [Phycisphaerales bacterium]